MWEERNRTLFKVSGRALKYAGLMLGVYEVVNATNGVPIEGLVYGLALYSIGSSIEEVTNKVEMQQGIEKMILKAAEEFEAGEGGN